MSHEAMLSRLDANLGIFDRYHSLSWAKDFIQRACLKCQRKGAMDYKVNAEIYMISHFVLGSDVITG